jgi:hypothetical protein
MPIDASPGSAGNSRNGNVIAANPLEDVAKNSRLFTGSNFDKTTIYDFLFITRCRYFQHVFIEF